MENKFIGRKPNRLCNYDYSQNGCYFITVCMKDKKHMLSHITNVGAGFHARPKEIVKTPIGYDFEKSLFFVANKYSFTVENYIIMPNHVHLLLTFDNDFYSCLGGCENLPKSDNNHMGGRGNPPLQKAIGEIKSYTTKLYRERENDFSLILWQRSFYDHIIRNEEDFQNTWNYIEYNALKEYGKNNKI